VKPSARYFSPVVYDAVNNRVTMFGGQGLLGFNSEVWVFDLWTKKWTHLSPGGSPPSQRAGSAAIYDRDNDGMVIFGGNDGAVRNDVWCITELSSTVTHAGPVLPSLELRSFPNPFNPTTTVEYVLPASGHVTMRVYDTNGVLVRAIVNETQSQGAHRVNWNGRNDAGVRVASGVYLLRIQSAGHAVTRKITLLK
jgi:hypothetical protein